MLRGLATLSACALVLTLFASPAHAESRTLVDARGDVWAMDTPEPGQNTQVRQRQQDDILRTVFAHHDRRVVVRTKFAQLDRVGEMWIMAINLRTSAGELRRVAILAGPGQWRGSVIRGNGRSLACATHRIDFDANVVELGIPRACLGNPRWVQASLAAGRIARDDVFYADNPANDGPSVRLPALTSRIFKG